MTERLYYTDSCLTEFSSPVISVEVKSGKSYVILEKTAFYPTTGGQQHDTGKMNGLRIIDVFEKDGKIVHAADGEIESKSVECSIDFNRRFDFMQQHSGQHLLTQTLIKLFGYDTVSSTLGEYGSVIELNTPSVTQAEMEEAESKVNEYVWKNIPVKTYFVSAEELEKLPVRKIPVVNGRIRIIEISDFDYSCCGGTHCNQTGEIGLIKIGKWEKIRGHARLEFLCGRRAFKDYQVKTNIISETGKVISCGENEILSNIDKIIRLNKSANKQIKKLKEMTAGLEAGELIKSGEKFFNCTLIEKCISEGSMEDIRVLAGEVVKTPGIITLLTAVSPDGRISVIFARSDDINVNIGQILKESISHIDGKGGGSPSFAQGGGNSRNGIKMMISSARKVMADLFK